ncbi:uncharacterized protein B0I36DRAFT_355257 [Microdochium trichocladiopsis]|uniref:C2H2-type domain-containing protein n=1 Tax=Microdochium trichocladiopsis TaxID=1682393 RepID=A0A9P8XTH8_9PEZI|nr:uncharacterized protein B0I36DRAFT_355257 [Microdochium trichocladiopsis]KAH7016470.1 hypothetical protein B0I36DRAFT_355257 [Microdochium trichocladiopsis]
MPEKHGSQQAEGNNDSVSLDGSGLACAFRCFRHNDIKDKAEQYQHHQDHLQQKLPHSCSWPTCAHSYCSKGRVNSHIVVDHVRAHPHLCNYKCGKRFKTFESLRRHEKTRHAERVATSGAYTSSDPRPGRWRHHLSSSTPSRHELSRSPLDSPTCTSQASSPVSDHQETPAHTLKSPIAAIAQAHPLSHRVISMDDAASASQALVNSTIQRETNGHQSYCAAMNYLDRHPVTRFTEENFQAKILQVLSAAGLPPSWDDPREWAVQTAISLRKALDEAEAAVKKHVAATDALMREMQQTQSVLRLCAYSCDSLPGVLQALERCAQVEALAKEVNLAFQARFFHISCLLIVPA